jgi:hemerythrin-like metal-binding protein
MIGSLRAAHASGVGWDAFAGILDQIIKTVGAHFDHEQDRMAAARYPRLDEHRTAHDTFLRRLRVLRAECDDRETELMHMFIELLDTWFKNHERTADAHVMAYLGGGPNA